MVRISMFENLWFELDSFNIEKKENLDGVNAMSWESHVFRKNNCKNIPKD